LLSSRNRVMKLNKGKRLGLISRRKEKKLTQQQVAESIGCNRTHYATIELGTKNPSFELTEKIIEKLEIDVKKWR
jgi:DNA-binding XRE family transcriptional regulator